MTAEQQPDRPEPSPSVPNPAQPAETPSTDKSPLSPPVETSTHKSPLSPPAETPPPEKLPVSPPVETPVLPAWTYVVAAFFRSGLFFMLFGTAFLYFAFANGQRAHSAMTFILVVIGSAIVLFGTGTQASGDLDGTEEGRAYKVKIAGGAGVMSLIIGYGLVSKGVDLKGVFRPERTIIVATLEAERSGSDLPGTLNDYYIEAYLDNLPVPVVRRERGVELYIPVTAADIMRKASLMVNIELNYRYETKVANLVELNSRVAKPLDLNELSDHSGGYDFQRALPIKIALQRPKAAVTAPPDVKLLDSEIPAIKFEGF